MERLQDPMSLYVLGQRKKNKNGAVAHTMTLTWDALVVLALKPLNTSRRSYCVCVGSAFLLA